MSLRRLYISSWLTTSILSIQINRILKRKIKDVSKMMPDTSKFIEDQNFDRFRKIKIVAKMV